jgi:DNA-binding response OmpR family regulator
VRILCVEDDLNLAKAVIRGLREEGYVVDHAATGSEARLLAGTRHYSLVILDRMLPEISGDHLLAEWRRKGLNTPVLMLTALDAVADRVTGLRGGADDYLVKPFAFEELLARLEALTRRVGGQKSWGTELRVGDLFLDTETGCLFAGGKRVKLTAQEFHLMELFMRHPGQILSRQTITDACWTEPEEISDNVIEAHIKNLRKRIAAVTTQPYLHTRRGLGYTLEAES